MSKYTKGPWVAVKYANYYSLQKEIYYSDQDNLLDDEKNPNAAADAKLAASAPELLNALQDMLNRFRFSEKGMIKADHVREQARIAIHNATTVV